MFVGQLQGQVPEGGGNFIQPQRQMLPQNQNHPCQGSHPAVIAAQSLASNARTSMNSTSQIRHMMAAAAVQQQHQMAPPPPQYRNSGAMSTRPNSTVAVCGGNGAYIPSVLRAQQQINTTAISGVPSGAPQSVAVAQQPVPSLPPSFQLPVFRGHVGFSAPTAAQDCLIGCVMLIVGYYSFREARKALWRKIIRSYGAEVVSSYDPARVTHIIMDWTLGDPDLYHQVIVEYFAICSSFFLMKPPNSTTIKLEAYFVI